MITLPLLLIPCWGLALEALDAPRDAGFGSLTRGALKAKHLASNTAGGAQAIRLLEVPPKSPRRGNSKGNSQFVRNIDVGSK